MSSANQEARDAIPHTCHAIANTLSAMAREFEPALRGLRELVAHLEPLVQVVARECARLDTAEKLLDQGWVPNRTTPYDLVSECGEDGAKLQTSLLAYYTDNWGEVRTRLESRLPSYGIDDEAKAAFGEALDAHEGGSYRTVSLPVVSRIRETISCGAVRRTCGQHPLQHIGEGTGFSRRGRSSPTGSKVRCSTDPRPERPPCQGTTPGCRPRGGQVPAAALKVTLVEPAREDDPGAAARVHQVIDG